MHGSSEYLRDNRFRQATIGFAVTLAPLSLLAGLQFLFAPRILMVAWEIDPTIEHWAVSSFRNNLIESYAYPVSLVIFYWLLAATIGKGAFLWIRSANLTLALSILSFALAVALASVAPPPFNAVCSFLGISQTDWPPGFDTQSSCERYSWMAAMSLAVVLPALLIAISAALRIFVSRRRSRSNVS
jgi:type IV secretory pathway TrbD component